MTETRFSSPALLCHIKGKFVGASRLAVSDGLIGGGDGGHGKLEPPFLL
jgi:hypothetical protein